MNELKKQKSDFVLPKERVLTMIQLTSRQQALLGYLLGTTEPVPVRAIAKQFQLSERTIRYDLDTVGVWIKNRGGELIKKPNCGISIEISDPIRKQLVASLSSDSEVVKVLTPEQRCEIIYYQLLFSSCAVTADDLSGKLLVSRPTIMGDLHSMRQGLAAKRLTITSKKGEGYKLQGKESDIRFCLVDALEKLLTDCKTITRYTLTSRIIQSLPRNKNDLRSLALNYLSSIDLDALAKLLQYSKEIMPYIMPESDHIRFLLYMAVLVYRVQQGAVLTEKEVHPNNKGLREYQLAALLANGLNSQYKLKLQKEEVDQLGLWLILCNTKFPPKADDKITEKLSAVLDKMIELLKSNPSYDMPDYFRDKLKINLLSHLRLTIKKHYLNISSPNPLLAQMKANYPDIFTVVYQMAEVFESETQIALDEDEIGFIAIHIAASIEECNRHTNKRALIVCNTGRGAAQVLQNRIRNNIPQLEIINTMAALDVEDTDTLKNIDLIISTVEMPELSKPVFRVSPIISAMEIEHINNYLNGKIGVHEFNKLPQDEEYMCSSLEQVVDKYVSAQEKEKCHNELKDIVDTFTMTKAKVIDSVSEENAMLQYSMILAKIGSAIIEISQIYNIKISCEQAFGLVIHILMSIPRWRKGSSNRKFASEQYKNEHLEIYEYLVSHLRETSSEYGVQIPDKEALALMRYFI
ncbi:MAG: PRD domain-containing protein [Angelakisella sp.]|nr:PRD domain-containing protein [Angelakisella sp.]